MMNNQQKIQKNRERIQFLAEEIKTNGLKIEQLLNDINSLQQQVESYTQKNNSNSQEIDKLTLENQQLYQQSEKLKAQQQNDQRTTPEEGYIHSDRLYFTNIVSNFNIFDNKGIYDGSVSNINTASFFDTTTMQHTTEQILIEEPDQQYLRRSWTDGKYLILALNNGTMLVYANGNKIATYNTPGLIVQFEFIKESGVLLLFACSGKVLVLNLNKPKIQAPITYSPFAGYDIDLNSVSVRDQFLVFNCAKFVGVVQFEFNALGRMKFSKKWCYHSQRGEDCMVSFWCTEPMQFRVIANLQYNKKTICSIMTFSLGDDELMEPTQTRFIHFQVCKYIQDLGGEEVFVRGDSNYTGVYLLNRNTFDTKKIASASVTTHQKIQVIETPISIELYILNREDYRSYLDKYVKLL